ncbi:MAG: YfhO family protein [Clostridia bacterium]|nr:YfhO family protein [Clostridia bacterium]
MKNEGNLIKRGNKKYLWLAFLAPCLLMYAIYFARGTFPFGDESVLVLDLNAQYVYFFGALRRALHGDASLIYSFSRALGGEFIGIFAYYLSSPLSWIVAFFPENMMLDALLVLFTTKCGLCGLTLAWYLDSHRIGTKTSRIIFGILYALCGYGVIYQHNTMWIDCMYLLPLVALGIEQLISKRKYLLFTISLGVAIFSSFYIGFMMCIFCFLYFFYAYFCVCKNECGEKKHFVKSLLRMGVFSAIALGLAACIVLPTYYSLGFGKTTFSDPSYLLESRYDFLDLVSGMFINAYDTVRPEGRPLVYCGLLTAILLPLFFMAKKVSIKEKTGTGVMIGIFVVSMTIDAIDKVWHGMQAPNWLNYRYSFMLVFIMIVAAAKAFCEIRHFTSGQKAGVIGAWFIILMMSQKTVEFSEESVVLDRTLLCFYVTAAFLAIYATALALFKDKTFKKAATSVLLIVVCAEMMLSGIISICYLDDDVVYSTRSSYLDNKAKYEDSADFILEHDDGFYRFDKTLHPLINTPMTLGIRGFTNSTSTLNKDTINFLQHLGLSSKSHWSKYYGGTPPFDAFLAVKYIIATDDYDVPSNYIPLYHGNATTVYQNPNALSVAYAVNDGIKEMHLAYPKGYKDDIAAGKYEEYTAYYTPAQRMNVMMSTMLGLDEEINVFVPVSDVKQRDANMNYTYVAEHGKYSPINADSAAALYYDFIAETDGIIYMYLPTDYPREASVLVNGVDKGTVLANETDRMISLGSFAKDESITVTLTLKDDRIYIREDEPLFWYVDMEVYDDSFTSLAENQFTIENWSDTKFEGKITATFDRTAVFTSIPYDANWRVWVDGEEVPTYENLEALVGFDITPGEHDVVIKYVPKQLYIGLAISAVSGFALIAIFVCEMLIKKHRASSAQEEETVFESVEEEPADAQTENESEAPAKEDTPEESEENK